MTDPNGEGMQSNMASAPPGLTLNGPVEVGVRVLMLLLASYPTSRTTDYLVLLDHGLLHSADLGGPESLRPPLPLRVGELGLRREAVTAGLRLMTRVGLVDMLPRDDGVNFQAADSAAHFADVMTSRHAQALRRAAQWSVENLGSMSQRDLQLRLNEVISSWTDQTPATTERSAENPDGIEEQP